MAQSVGFKTWIFTIELGFVQDCMENFHLLSVITNIWLMSGNRKRKLLINFASQQIIFKTEQLLGNRFRWEHHWQNQSILWCLNRAIPGSVFGRMLEAFSFIITFIAPNFYQLMGRENIWKFSIYVWEINISSYMLID